MHELYELKETLCNQLKEYAGKDVSAGMVDVVDKLAHACKNLDKIIEKYENDEYSNDMMYDYRNRNSYGNSYGNAYARGRNARRDSMGRYSRERGYSNDMMADLHELMEQAPDEKTRMEFQQFIRKMEQK